MKINQIFVAFAILAFAFISCNKEENDKTQEGTVEFSFSSASLHSRLKSGQADSISNVAAVVITVEDLSGKKLYNNESIELYNMNGYYISKPVSLVPGGYKLTKFMVVDASNKVLYLTPMENSPKAYLVNDPLPIAFTVSKDNVTKVVPEVISAKNSKPQDFGYATFSFENVATFDFLIGVFAYNVRSQNFEMTTAHLSIAADSGWVYEKEVPAATDTITVKDNQSSYILTVTKEGYKTWTDTLNASQLKEFFVKPLIVMLEKGDEKNFWFITDQSKLTPVKVQLYVIPEDSNFFINWGDGLIQRIQKTQPDDWGYNHVVTHMYTTQSKYKVTVTGALNKIQSMCLDSCQLENININQCINLFGIAILHNRNLTKLDLSNLPLLRTVYVSVNNINELILNNSNEIRSLDINSNNLQNLDLSGRTKLQTLGCQRCNINNLNLTNCPNLNKIYCDFNNLSTLDVSSCTGLVEFQCTQNNLTEIDISRNLKLKDFSCSNNNISLLDVSQNKNLIELNCAHLNLSDLDISQNPLLNSMLICDNNFSASTIDKILSDLLTNVRANNIMNGKVNFAPEPGTIGNIALNELIQTFKWGRHLCY